VGDDRSTYRPTFRAEPLRYGAPPPVVRLRRLLRVALRARGFRCVEVREAEAPEGQRAPEGWRRSGHRWTLRRDFRPDEALQIIG
jgi:hypothetical protein